MSDESKITKEDILEQMQAGHRARLDGSILQNLSNKDAVQFREVMPNRPPQPQTAQAPQQQGIPASYLNYAEQLLEQMRALACAKVNDAVKLAYLPEEEREAIGKLDLSALIEFRRSGAGTVELKFADRMKALERLLELSGPSSEEQLDSLLRRMEDEEE